MDLCEIHDLQPIRAVVQLYFEHAIFHAIIAARMNETTFSQIRENGLGQMVSSFSS